MSSELRGTARNTWTGILLEYGHLIPHYPGVDVIKPARLPPPPRLTGEDADEWALQLLRAYQSTVSHFYAKALPYRRLTVADVYAHRNARVLREAAIFLRAADTQPFAWCEFSVYSWSKYGPKKYKRFAPSLQWVYGPKRLAQHDQWYQWRGSNMQGARLILSKYHLELIRRYDKLRAALIEASREPDLTSEDVGSIVRRLLPRRLYAQLVADAQADSEDIQSDIDRAMKRGDFIWDR